MLSPSPEFTRPPGAALRSYHELGGLKPAEMYSLPVPEVRGLKSRGQQDCFFLEAPGENLCPLSQLLVAVATLSIPWLPAAPHPSDPVVAGPASLCVSMGPLLLRTPVIGFGACPHPV